MSSLICLSQTAFPMVVWLPGPKLPCFNCVSLSTPLHANCFLLQNCSPKCHIPKQLHYSYLQIRHFFFFFFICNPHLWTNPLNLNTLAPRDPTSSIWSPPSIKYCMKRPTLPQTFTPICRNGLISYIGPYLFLVGRRCGCLFPSHLDVWCRGGPLSRY